MVNKDNQTALLVMDVQKWNITDKHKDVVRHMQQAIQHARELGQTIIWVQLAFGANYPELNPQNKFFSMISPESHMTKLDEQTQPHPELVPQANDYIVNKYRVSAFAGSNLESILKAQSINHLILCGISTSGVVLSTLTEASDKDYQLSVLHDACFDKNASVHDVLVHNVFSRHADVLSVGEWVAQSTKQP